MENKLASPGNPNFEDRPIKEEGMSDKGSDFLSSTTAPEASPLDPSALDQIRALEKEGASNLVEEVIHLYLRDALTLKGSMAEAAAQGRADGLRRAAHTFKSISATVGAMTLSALCKELERLGREGRLENVEAILAEVDKEYGRVTGALKKEVQKSGQ